LVKCSNITDDSVIALARNSHRARTRRDAHGNFVSTEDFYVSSLERVHLSYCIHLTLNVRFPILRRKLSRHS
jgi:F-box and leucine-rich repeat protein GRR1